MAGRRALIVTLKADYTLAVLREGTEWDQKAQGPTPGSTGGTVCCSVVGSLLTNPSVMKDGWIYIDLLSLSLLATHLFSSKSLNPSWRTLRC